MKKSIVLGAFALIALASCKKDYSCVCTATNGSSTATSTTTINDTKKNAEAKCDEGDASIGSSSVSCELK